MDSLVTSSTLTQAQEDSIKSALVAAKPFGPAKGERIKGGKDGFKTVLDSLVTSGTLTQAQEDSIQSAIHAYRPRPLPNR